MIILITSISFSSCQKESQNILIPNSATSNSPTIEKEFLSPHNVSLQNGMLVFPSRRVLDSTLYEIATSNIRSIDNWEQEIGLTTHRRIFQQVIAAEDSLEQTYISMSGEQRDNALVKPQPHSDLYDYAIKKHFIKVITDKSDGSKYFDYAVIDPSMAAVINEFGLIKVENIIYEYSPKSKKMILDGDFRKVPSLKI
ncbi:MAG: hypothetical protein HC817_04335 [Saprospiraceae bacterium]|nr:hypothetical protein [Saprospiraceae bacterium]